MNRRTLAIIAVMLCAFIGIYLMQVESSKESVLDTTVAGDSQGVIGWGFRKIGPGQAPEFTSQQVQIMSKYKAIYLGNQEKKTVSLTFDLGYENGYTEQILKVLNQQKVKAIFFVTGPWLKENPDLAKKIVQGGHILGNHTVNHPCLATVDRATFDKEILELETEIYRTTKQNKSYKFLRPPKGEYNENVLKWAKDLGYTNVFWSVALKDWLPLPGPEVVTQEVKKQLHPGAVILLHGVSKEVTEALPEVITFIKAEGYEIRPITKFVY